MGASKGVRDSPQSTVMECTVSDPWIGLESGFRGRPSPVRVCQCDVGSVKRCLLLNSYTHRLNTLTLYIINGCVQEGRGKATRVPRCILYFWGWKLALWDVLTDWVCPQESHPLITLSYYHKHLFTQHLYSKSTPLTSAHTVHPWSQHSSPQHTQCKQHNMQSHVGPFH